MEKDHKSAANQKSAPAKKSAPGHYGTFAEEGRDRKTAPNEEKRNYATELEKLKKLTNEAQSLVTSLGLIKDGESPLNITKFQIREKLNAARAPLEKILPTLQTLYDHIERDFQKEITMGVTASGEMNPILKKADALLARADYLMLWSQPRPNTPKPSKK